MKKKLKIVHFVSSFTSGGAEMLVKEIADNQNELHQVEIWAMNPGSNKEFMRKYAKELSEKGISTLVFGSKPNRMRFSRFMKIRKAIRDRKPDIINTHSEVITGYLVFASIGSTAKIVQTIHNTIIEYNYLQRIFIKHMINKFIAISVKTQEVISFELNILKKDVPIIYNGICLERFQKQIRNIRPEVKKIICIGRLVPQKDHKTLLDAYKLLIKRLNSESLNIPILYIVGDGNLKNNLLSQTKALGITEFVKFLGVRNDIPELLYESDILVMASRWEGLSIALLEASATGIPVVATDVGSNKEIVEDGVSGFLVPSEDPSKFADAVYSVIISKELRENFSHRAIQIANSFTIEETVKKYTKLYQEICS